MGGQPAPRVVSVVPDVRAVERTFDYLVPAHLGDHVRVGTMVRVSLGGRRVGGWVVDDDVVPPPGVTLRPLGKVTGWGPPADLVDLARWAAWRWYGPVSAVLGSASPLKAVSALPTAPDRPSPASVSADPLVVAALDRGPSVLRLPPAADLFPVVATAVASGPSLVLASTRDDAARLAGRLRDAGVPTALLPEEWPRARAGGVTVVGARGGAWAPVPEMAAVVVLDAHDEAYAEERAPTWNGRDVAIERASRRRIPCVVVSPCPDLETLSVGRLVAPTRREEREGWPPLEVVDRRDDDPSAGMYSKPLVDAVRGGRRVLCVLNRRGRARLLACHACGELARCERCGAVVAQPGEDGGDRGSVLRCRRCALERPPVCTVCGGARLRVLRAGVSRVREELEALSGRPVAEVSGATRAVPHADVMVGTEAVLHRVGGADVVAFLDLDQELLAPRYRANEQALALLARAARLVGGRRSGGRLVVQTRQPGHDVIAAALHGDPSRVTGPEAERRHMLSLPPAAALALVSGDAAAEFVARLAGVEVLGPDRGRWLVRAGDHHHLCNALAIAGRPPGRLRVEVDPRRV